MAMVVMVMVALAIKGVAVMTVVEHNGKGDQARTGCTCILLLMIVCNESMMSELADSMYQLVRSSGYRYLTPDVEPRHNSYFCKHLAIII